MFSKSNCCFLNLKYSTIFHLFKYTLMIVRESLLSVGFILLIIKSVDKYIASKKLISKVYFKSFQKKWGNSSWNLY